MHQAAQAHEVFAVALRLVTAEERPIGALEDDDLELGAQLEHAREQAEHLVGRAIVVAVAPEAAPLRIAGRRRPAPARDVNLARAVQRIGAREHQRVDPEVVGLAVQVVDVEEEEGVRPLEQL